MRFDKILDFLFHSVKGILLTVSVTLISVFTLSGCFVYDCSVWMCRTITCNEDACQGCLETSIQFNDEQYARQLRNTFGLNDWKKRFMTDEQIEDAYTKLDCYYGEEGCESDENCGYIVCGGTNLSCWNTICEGGLCINGMKLYDGSQTCTCLNCTVYCDGKPSEGEYIPDTHGKSCAGCDNGPYKPKDYDDSLYHPYYTVGVNEMANGCASQKDYSSAGTNLGSVKLLIQGDEVSTFATVYIYDKTLKVPTPKKDGYDFRGYYTAPNGRGEKLTDEMGVVKDNQKLVKAGRAGGAYAYFAPKQTAEFETRIEISYNGNDFSDIVTLGADIEAIINNIYPLDYGNRMISVVATYGDFNIEIASTQGFLEEYKIFDPADYGIELHYEVLYLTVTEQELFHTVTLRGFNSEETHEYLHGTTVAMLPVTAIEGYTFLGWSVGEDSIEGILSYDSAISASQTLWGVYRKNLTVYFEDFASGNASYRVYDGEVITLPVAITAPDGMRFAGWYPKGGLLNGGETMDEADALFETLEVTEAFDGITLAPLWSSCTYTVEYFVNGALYATGTYDFGVGMTLPTEIDNEFYTFLGWSASEGSSTPVQKIESTEYGDKSFFAMLTPNSYTLALNSADGIVMSPTVTLVYGEAAGNYFIETPSRDGYDFAGWYIMKDGERLFVTDALGTSVIPFTAEALGVGTKDELLGTVFIADWKVKTYTVRFYAEGELYATEEVEHGGTIKANGTPTIPGYDFVSWMLFGSVFDTSSPITSPIDLIAKINPKSYKITLFINDFDGYFAWADSDGYGIYGDTYDVICTYGTAIVLDEVEVYGIGEKAFIGWSHNGEIVIDAAGNVVNPALLGNIAPDGSGYIHLVAAWE